MAAPWLTGLAPPAAPPGVDARAFALAMFEDLHELVAGLDLVDAAVLTAPGLGPQVEPLIWPGTPLAEVTPPDAATALAALAHLGADVGLVLAADAPDLPPLLVGKAMRALGSADVAYCPATDGSTVFLAARLPLPSWVAEVAPSLDDPSAAGRLRAAAPRRTAVAATPGWHRIRTTHDLAMLDPGLEGWDVTRLLLAGRPLRQPG